LATAAVELGEGEPMPGSFLLYVADPDAMYQQALAAGATSIMRRLQTSRTVVSAVSRIR
jgi:uncharacterized glyoxalase superfamily protein PhnB